MTFESYGDRPRKSGSRAILRVTPNGLTVGWEVGKVLGFPDRLVVAYDKRTKQIRVTPADQLPSETSYKAHWSRSPGPGVPYGVAQMSAFLALSNLWKDMPLGDYIAINRTTFQHESLTK